MKSLATVDNFGGTDADNDDILLRAFEDHEAYLDVLALRRHLIIGKKGSGKTAIFKKIITTRSHDFFAYGHTFSDYPWHYHERQARVGIPEFDKYTHSWKYLILLSAAKIALNQDQSLPVDASSMEEMVRLESFVVDTYGSRDPDLTQVFSPTKHLKLKPHFELDWKILKAGISPEAVPVLELPTIVQEVNAAFVRTVLRCLNPTNRYYIAFDQLDLGFDRTSPEYTSISCSVTTRTRTSLGPPFSTKTAKCRDTKASMSTCATALTSGRGTSSNSPTALLQDIQSVRDNQPSKIIP